MSLYRAALAGATCLALARDASTQDSDATLVGTVRDSARTVVALATVGAAGKVVVTDSAGWFALRRLPAGSTSVVVRRLGFAPVELSTVLAAGRTDTLEVLLAALPAELAGVTASADPTGRLDRFYRHRATGDGVFFDRKGIESHRVSHLSDLLRRVSGLRVTTGSDGRRHVRMGRSIRGRDCPPDLWVDGIRGAGMSIDEMPLEHVEALEIYKGASTVPAEYNDRFGDPSCGTIVVWTRVP